MNERGLHARASAKFVGAVAEITSETNVRVAKGGNEASGGSILGLMMLGAARGDEVELIVSGAEADTVMSELAIMIEDGFGEP